MTNVTYTIVIPNVGFSKNNETTVIYFDAEQSKVTINGNKETTDIPKRCIADVIYKIHDADEKDIIEGEEDCSSDIAIRFLCDSVQYLQCTDAMRLKNIDFICAVNLLKLRCM